MMKEEFESPLVAEMRANGVSTYSLSKLSSILIFVAKSEVMLNLLVSTFNIAMQNV